MGGKTLALRFLGLCSYQRQAHRRAQSAMLECARQIRLYVEVLLVTNTLVGLMFWADLWGIWELLRDRRWWYCSRSWLSIRTPVSDWQN